MNACYAKSMLLKLHRSATRGCKVAPTLLLLMALLPIGAQAQVRVAKGMPIDPIDIRLMPTATLTVSYSPGTLVAGEPWVVNWSSTDATSVGYSCTAAGTGYNASGTVDIGGALSATASSAWVGYPSTCTWTAYGTDGLNVQVIRTMTTVPAVPIIAVTRSPSPMTAGQGYTLSWSSTGASSVSRACTASGSGFTANDAQATSGLATGLTTAGDEPTIGFTGHVNDADTGLVYMQQRYYDPVAGRFLSIDPVTTDANTGGSFNRYAYANNSPFRYIDPDGREAADKWGDVFKAEMSNPQGERFEAFHTPALAVTGVMLIVPVAVVVGPVAVAAVKALPIDKIKAVVEIVVELKKLTGTPIPNVPKITVITAQQVVKTITKTANTSKALKPAAPPPPPPPPPIPPPV